MDSREALIAVILPSTNEARAGIARHAADAILASDWLKADRERVRREAMLEAARIAEDRHEKWGPLHEDDDYEADVSDDASACADIAAAIRAAAGGDDATPPSATSAPEHSLGMYAPETADERQAAIVARLRDAGAEVGSAAIQVDNWLEYAADWIESGEWRR